ncbi:MAG: serine/threonine-protein kinase [Planctomycetota bacterium]
MMPADALILDDSIRLTRCIGRGVTGEVWEAHQSGADRVVAVKLRHERTTSGDWQREAHMLARVEHPHIVAVLLHGRLDGRQALVLERVDGADLQRMLDALRDREEAPSAAVAATALGLERAPGAWVDPFWRTAAAIVRDVARALDHAHRCGVVHRDVKPANILVDRSGSARLSDFGLAASAGAAEGGDAVAGTLAYMGPERLEGGRATPASDVYSLGVVLRELVTLEAPLQATTLPGAIAEIAQERASRRAHPGVSRDLRAILARATAQRPEERYGTAGDLARDLQALLDDRPVLARPEGVAARMSRFVRRRRLAVCSFLGCSIAIAAVASVIADQVVRSAVREARAAELSRAALDQAMASWDDVVIDSAISLVAGKPMLERVRAGVLERALRMGDELLEASSGEDGQFGRIHAVRARTLTALATSMRSLGRWERSRKLSEEARESAGELPAELRRETLARCALIDLTIANDIGSADEKARTAEAARTLLYDDMEPLPGFDYMRPSVWSVLAGVSSRRGDPELALEYAERAIDAARELDAESSFIADATRRIELARSLGVRSAVLHDLGRHEEGGRDAQRVIESLEGLMHERSAQKICGSAWNNVASMRRHEGRWSDSLDAERRALELQEAIVAGAPDANIPRFDYAMTLYRIAWCMQRSGGDPEQVERSFARALVELDRVLHSNDALFRARELRAATRYWLAKFAQESGRAETAEESYGAAAADYAWLHEERPTDETRLKVRESIRRHVGSYLAAHGPRAGIDRIREVAGRFSDDEITLYHLATMTAYGSTKSAGGWLEVSEEACSLAIDLLLAAYAAGLRETEYIETSPAFASVRAHDRYAEVRAASMESR